LCSCGDEFEFFNQSLTERIKSSGVGSNCSFPAAVSPTADHSKAEAFDSCLNLLEVGEFCALTQLVAVLLE